MFNQLNKEAKNLENKLKEIREEKRITQEELAEKSGVSRTTISGLENKTIRNNTSKTLMAIAKALNVGVEEIFLF